MFLIRFFYGMGGNCVCAHVFMCMQVFVCECVCVCVCVCVHRLTYVKCSNMCACAYAHVFTTETTPRTTDITS